MDRVKAQQQKYLLKIRKYGTLREGAGETKLRVIVGDSRNSFT